MKLRKKQVRALAITLSAMMMMSGLPATAVYAATSDSEEDIVIEMDIDGSAEEDIIEADEVMDDQDDIDTGDDFETAEEDAVEAEEDDFETAEEDAVEAEEDDFETAEEDDIDTDEEDLEAEDISSDYEEDLEAEDISFDNEEDITEDADTDEEGSGEEKKSDEESGEEEMTEDASDHTEETQDAEKTEKDDEKRPSYKAGDVLTEGVGTDDTKEEEKESTSEVKDAFVKLGKLGYKDFVSDCISLFGSFAPGGSYLTTHLTSMIGVLTDIDSDTDLTAKALKELSESQDKNFAELHGEIKNLNDDVDRYAKLLNNKIVNQEKGTTLGDLFRDMNKNLVDVSDRIDAIKRCDSYSPEQKLVLLADLNNDSCMKDLRQTVYTIDRSTMKSGEDVFDVNLYKTLMDISAEKKMFKGEAYDESKEAVSTLIEQYMNANAMLLECQIAACSMNLTPEQEKALNNDKVAKKAYDKCRRPENMHFQKSKMDQTLKIMENCFDSLEEFDENKYTLNTFINQNSAEPVVLDFSEIVYDNVQDKGFKELMNAQYLDKKNMDRFLDYIRKETKGQKSVYDYLKENHQDLDFSVYKGFDDNENDYNEHRYIVVDSTITTTRKRNESKDYSVGYRVKKGYKDWVKYHVNDVTETIKVVDIYDPECKVQDLIVKTYEENDQPGTANKNVKFHMHDYIKIRAHAPGDSDKLTKNADGQLVCNEKRANKEVTPQTIWSSFLDGFKEVVDNLRGASAK